MMEFSCRCCLSNKNKEDEILKSCLCLHTCTKNLFKNNQPKQEYFKCLTCNPYYLICIFCAMICHKNHNLVRSKKSQTKCNYECRCAGQVKCLGEFQILQEEEN